MTNTTIIDAMNAAIDRGYFGKKPEDIIVFQFTRDMKFKKFSVKAGEKWRINGSAKPSFINQLPYDGYFEMGGSDCRKSDIQVLYFGADWDRSEEMMRSIN